jgi:hypothetical protein
MNHRVKTIILSSMLLVGGLAVRAQDSVIVNISPAACPYADSHLAERLEYKLSTLNHQPLAVNIQIAKPAKFENLEQVITRGKAQKARFLIDITVEKLDLIQKKITVVPLAVYRYQVYGIITGQLRIVDVAKRRVAKMDRFYWEMKGSDQWQLIDDDPTDPALKLPADEKISLFDALEEKAAVALFEDIKAATRGNHFDSQE